jgi:hypothetical protein
MNETEALTEKGALMLKRAPRPLAPALLAASCAGGVQQRATMRALYLRCLVRYRAVLEREQAEGEVDDVGAAAARFVAANMQALQGVAVTLPMLVCLERQLSGMVASSTDWKGRSLDERQVYFEKLAIVAVLVSESWAQAQGQGALAIANVRRAARGYLRELLGIDPVGLILGENGLTVRSAGRALAVPA